MLTHINRWMKNKAFTTTELAILVLLVAAAFTGIKIYVERSLKAKVHKAVVWSDANDGLGAGPLQFEPDYVQDDTQNTENSTSDLLIGTDAFTNTENGGTNTTGEKNILAPTQTGN